MSGNSSGIAPGLAPMHTDEKFPQAFEQPLDAGERDVDSQGDTFNDVQDMKRLGKKQEFKRNFGFLSALGFVSIYLATWEFVLLSLSANFSNGGFAGLFWCFISTVICYSSIVASLAEMESMAPTAGGQYHWVSEFAPPDYQKVLSYASGWMSTLGWLASVTSSEFIVATQVQSLIQVSMPDFSFTAWQYTLIMIGFTIVTIVFNTWGAKSLPMLQTLCLFGHILGFVIVMIPLLVLCPKNSTHDVFLDFEVNGGWSPVPAYLISQVTVLYCNIGSDSVVHISEEVEDASIVVPRCMWWAYVGNVIVGIGMLITMLYCIPPLADTLQSDVPYLVLFENTGSAAISYLLNAVLLILVYVGNVTALATGSREVFAFARDKGLPLSGWLGRINHEYNVPFNSVYAVSAVVAVFCLINLGSTLAFNIIVSLSLLGLMSTYTISISCVLRKRLAGEPLPPARWSLGRYGIVINAFAVFYSSFIVVFSCFPTFLPVDVSSTNWAPVVWVGVMVISVITYIFYGRHHYTAPVTFVEGRKEAGVGLQTT